MQRRLPRLNARRGKMWKKCKIIAVAKCNSVPAVKRPPSPAVGIKPPYSRGLGLILL